MKKEIFTILVNQQVYKLGYKAIKIPTAMALKMYTKFLVLMISCAKKSFIVF